MAEEPQKRRELAYFDSQGRRFSEDQDEHDSDATGIILRRKRKVADQDLDRRGWH